MKIALLWITTAIAFVVFLEHAQAAESAHDLVSDCYSLERGKIGTGRHIQIPNTKKALVCWGFMEAMQALSVLIDEQGRRIIGACPPETVTTLDLIQAFLKYARSHRSELEGNAAVAVINAFQEAFPCSQAAAPLE